MDDFRTRLDVLEHHTIMLTHRAHQVTRQFRWWRGGTYALLGRLAVAAGLLILLGTFGPIQAAVLPCPSGDVTCLITAIETANGNAEDDTIILGAGTYTLTTVDNETDGPNGVPSITSTLTIRGAGAEATIIAREAGAPRFRLIHIAAAGALTLEGLTLRGGLTPDDGGGLRNRGTVHVMHSTITGSVADVGSGGGLCNSGTANLTHATITGNEADGAGGLDNRGGGIMNISDSHITDNGASICGGLINGGTLTMSRTTVAGNGAPFGGGGILNGDVMTIINSAITGNSGDLSGGIINRGVMTIANSTIARNDGGASGVGGIFNEDDTITITNSTIAENTTFFGRGGGLLNTEGTVVTLQNTILARNTIDQGEDGEVAADCQGPVTSLGTNLVGEPSGCTLTLRAGDLTGDPGLAPFTADGTPGHGHFPLLASSPAVDAGNAAACPPTDQLGRPRVGICDIGAVEFQAEAVTIRRAAFADQLARLWVSATSSAPPDAALAVTVPGCLAQEPMRRLGSRYVLLRHVEACGDLTGQTVTVTSTYGGSASAPLR